MAYDLQDVINSNTGQDFQALAEVGEFQVIPGDRATGPSLIFGGGQWVYLVGTKPAANAQVAVIASSSTKIVIHRIAAGIGQARTRFIVLESTSTTTVSLPDGSGSQVLNSGQYVDVWHSTPAQIDTPQTFNASTNTESQPVMQAVAAARAAEGMS